MKRSSGKQFRLADTSCWQLRNVGEMQWTNWGLGYFFFVTWLVTAGLPACSSDNNPKLEQPSQYKYVDAGVLNNAQTDASAPADASTQEHCHPVQGQPIPARLAAESADAGVSEQTPVFVDDIYNRFVSTCGACHVSSNQGGLQINRSSFVSQDVQAMLNRVLSNDPTVYMPPQSVGGKAAQDRSPDDPVMQLAGLLQAWLAAGQPADVFYMGSTTTTDTTHPYLLTPDEGAAMTNIGACLPDKEIVATEQAKMDEFDTKFAGLQVAPTGQGSLADRLGLPEHLVDTDLFTLDTEVLARHGVIAYAPAYPLWSDNAGKLRLVRVPRGQSIIFDKSTQTFVIPPNTRFYKTFLKSVVDTDGTTHFRKVETRLIVSRPDTVMSDGSRQPNALFGTYAWDDAETEATLVTDPLRNGEPFADRLITYVTDEPTAANVAAGNPPSLSFALQNAGALRHYAIPGSDRCIDCHKGSPSQSFVLGFTPLQIKRRPQGQGGIIDAAASDELTQLQRLIDYGVITGIQSADDMLNLEDSQGNRKPRNNYELTAQGYMVGNCAHCHNPHGDASVNNPVLADVLNFMPGPNGGIFQFPLEKMSPRILRGASADVTIPYLTPSLMDYPVEDDGGHQYWTPKADTEQLWDTNVNIHAPPPEGLPGKPNAVAFAPWRSLIYRNVDTPFDYVDDFALFPHMPRNVPGYNCRLPQIMGDWMVSIPARRKHTNIWEFGAPQGGTCIAGGNELCDNEPQPYEEAMPSDADYQTALSDAQQRLDLYHTGNPPWEMPMNGPYPNRYTFCPDTSDIVDLSILQGPSTACNPKLVPTSGSVMDLQNHVLVQPDLGVPLHAHWVVTDTTQVPGPWSPRRADWEQIIVQQNFPTSTGTNCPVDLQKLAAEKTVVQLLQNVTFTNEIKSYTLNPIPFGLWMPKSNCDLSAFPTVAQLPSDNRPKWVAQVSPPPSPDNPVYAELPGAAVFNMICTNCHGPKADSQGRLASTLLNVTGGSVRVADLRDGLFGPVGSGSNRASVFGNDANNLGITSDDMAARYLAWMALGGTNAQIPAAILNIVGYTQVLGASRKSNPI